MGPSTFSHLFGITGRSAVESITPRRAFDDVILSPVTRSALEAALAQVTQHDLIFKSWGLGERHSTGLGLAFNFAGPPGTGKTICAEAIAKSLGRQLLVVRYAELESMWMGETSKNVAAIFRTAREEQAVLLFDEADAIAARRSTSVDSGSQRESNSVVNVLLQELERYTGVVIFATNLAANFDPAFERRIRTHVLFELPGETERARIWKVQVHPFPDAAGPGRRFQRPRAPLRSKRRRHPKCCADLQFRSLPRSLESCLMRAGADSVEAAGRGGRLFPNEIQSKNDGLSSQKDRPIAIAPFDLLMQAPTPLLILAGPQHYVNFINPPYVRLLHRNSDEGLLGKPICEALPEFEGQGFLELLDQVYRTGEPYVGTEPPVTLLREDNGVREDAYFNFTYQPLRGADGQVEGIMVQATEVAALVRARQDSEGREQLALRQSSELEAIYESAPIGFALYDPEQFRLLRLNENLAEILGVPVVDVLGKSVLEVAPHLAGLRELFQKVARDGSVESHIVEGELPSQPGVQRHWLLNHTPLFSPDGNIEAIKTISLEITAQKEAEAALAQIESLSAVERNRLEEERQRFVALADTSRDFIAMWDMEGKPFYANPAALHIVGLDSVELLNHTSMDEFFFPEDRRLVTAELLPKVLREGYGEVEIRFRHLKTGEPIWMCYQLFVMRNAAGEPLGLATISRDLTSEKRGETALIQSEKLAAVGRLASSIAHEINNPLASVTNTVYLARQYENQPEVQRLLEIADEELRRVSLITTQTLRFHKQSSKPQTITCADLFSSVLNLYAGRLKNANIRIHQRGRRTEPVECFEGDIRQVLSNVISNAIDAMPQGGHLLVRYRAATDWRSGRYGLVLTVADTGCGIAAEAQNKIFEPFYSTKGIGGTGLGLWISGQIMERHRGSIQIRSSQLDPHRGTVVTLFIPVEGSLTDQP